MMLEKNEREITQLLCLYSQFPNWLIHSQELESVLGTKFLQKGCWILQLSLNTLEGRNRKPKVGVPARQLGVSI